jgi:hypothetical protein
MTTITLAVTAAQPSAPARENLLKDMVAGKEGLNFDFSSSTPLWRLRYDDG